MAVYHDTKCKYCGHNIIKADINASINILNRATLGQRGSHAHGDMTSAIQQESKSRIEELRTYPANAGEANDL